jgi:hypothetical protein
VGFDFVSYDDPHYIYENAQVRRGLTWEGVSWAFTTGQAGNYHPLTWLSLMLDRSLFGDGPRGFHRTNVLLHAANAALLLLALRALTGSTWRSAAVALVWAVHPLRRVRALPAQQVDVGHAAGRAAVARRLAAEADRRGERRDPRPREAPAARPERDRVRGDHRHAEPRRCDWRVRPLPAGRPPRQRRRRLRDLPREDRLAE